MGQTLLPGVRAPLPDTPATPGTWREKIGQGSSTTGPSINDAEIEELARGLKYDPGLMYKFVHDHIHFTPMWGEVKGPYMTWMDRSGNAFDQASLMIALLKQAAEHGSGYTITNPKYVVGEIQLTAAQFTSWFSVPNDAQVARQVLARAGLYGAVTANGEAISEVHLEHVWVKVTIDGEIHQFDPSFKSHTKGSRITNFRTAMGYDSTTFYNHAIQGATINEGSSVKDINKANIASDLTTYTNNLIDMIKTEHSGDDLTDIIGGSRIDAVAETALPPVSLPYTVYHTDEDFPIEEIPSIYRTTLRIQHCGIDQTLYSSDIYGRRLSLKYNASNQPQLILDGTVKATGNTTTPGQSYDLTYIVNHPYESADFDGTVTVKVTAGGFYHILNGWGDTGTKILLKHRDLLQQYRHDGLSDSSEQVLGESFTLVGLTWLAQNSLMRSLAAGTTDHVVIGHHLLGVTGQYNGPYIDVPLTHLGIVNATTVNTDVEGTFLAIAGHASAYEHEVIRQLQDCNAVSTVRLMEMANDRTTYDHIYSAVSGSWSSVQSQLQGYSQAEKDQVTPYINAGYTVFLPEYGDLTEEDWTGTGFQPVLLGTSMLTTAHIVGGGYKGAAASDNTGISPSKLIDYGYGATTGLDSEGAYGTGATDIAIGGGGLPFGLAFGRQYSSNRRLEDGPLGLGWSHNLDIAALVRSDSFRVLDNASPMEAAFHIVTLYVTQNIDSDVLSRNVIASLCQTWLMDQMMHNLVIMKQGAGRTSFVKRPDTGNKYLAPGGQNLRLITQDDGTFLVKNSSGIFYDFDSNGRLFEWSDAYGNKVSFTYTSGNLTQVATKIGGSVTSRTLSFTYTDNHITTVTDSASRSISYTYDAYGDLTHYTNPDANETIYEYDATKHGLMTKIYSPVDQVNPFVTIVYDSLCRMKQIVDANDCTWDFYRATYRSEVLEPNQLDPNDEVKRYGTMTWANPDNRSVTSIDQLGRKTTSTYDGQSRPTSMVSPAGTSAEMTYDENNNLIQADSFSIPESGDPDVLSQYGYCSYGNPDDPNRWFVRMKQQTDTTGKVSLYYYDFNEPSPPSYVGNLIKIVAPQADPPGDVNRPTALFSYYPNGQMHTQTDPNGLVAHYEYYPYNQGAGLKKTIVDPNGLGIATEVTYDSVGRVATAKDPRGNIATNQYYASGRLKKTIAPSPFSYETTYEYYADGKVKYVKQNTPQGLVYLQDVIYNNRGLKATVRGPYPANPTQDQLQVNYTQYAYDALGRLWKVTDAEGNITTTRYYPDGKTWKVIDAEGHNTVTNVYNTDGSLKEVHDANDNVTRYEYNGFMGLKKTIYSDDTYEQPTYDGFRRLTQMRKRGGEKIEPAYDGLGRVKTKTVKKADNTVFNTITYKYDKTGRLLRTTDNTGTTTNTYDKVGRLTKITYPGSKTVQYQYDIGSNRTRLTYPDASYITYEYDELSRLTKIRNQGGTILAQYAYDARSRRTALDYANGTGIDYNYDTASRLLYVDNQTVSGQHKYGYTYDHVGSRMTMSVIDGSGTKMHVYNYDKIYQLKDVNYPTGYDYLATDTTFNYDAVGNRTTVVDGSGTATYATNALNQYTAVADVNYTYDNNGNMTYDGSFAYGYDPENRLTTATKVPEPLSAACDTTLTFTTGGNANWFVESGEHRPGGDEDAAQSGDISDSQNTWIETTVNGQGFIYYWRKISSQVGDSFSVWIDGQEAGFQSGEVGWSECSKGIGTLGPHKVRWKYSKDSSGSGGQDCAWLDQVRWEPVTQSPVAELGLALDTDWDVYTAGDGGYQWSKDSSYSYYGGSSACSGSPTENKKTSMEVVVNGAGPMSFYWKVSSEPGGDYLEFYIDGVLKDSISGNVDWQQKSYTLTGTGSHSLVWIYSKDSSGSSGSDCGWVDYLRVPCSPPYTPPPANELDEAVDSTLAFATSGAANWSRTTSTYYYDGDSAQSGTISGLQDTWMKLMVGGAGTLTFYWKVSSQAYSDYLEFYIDGARQDRISGSTSWQQKSYNISGSGNHLVKWRYVKDYSGSSGSDCGWVDKVEWTGSAPQVTPAPVSTWTEVGYTYDPAGRRIEKKYDGTTVVKYLYDGDHCIAEYDGNNNLLRKYLYGPAVDEPISMIDVEHSNATYYYHFDGLGSVIGLTNASGTTAVLYEYSVYGQVAASDPNHPNRFMFTGREFDKETGLYYYRARYYNPEIGRFLQTDPIGYGAGMNLYAYCGNRPIVFADPSGLAWEDPNVRIVFYDGSERDRYGDPFFDEALDDDYWDLAFDISASAAAAHDFGSSEEYARSIMENIRQYCEGHGYSWSEMTIEGVWIFDHGAEFGDDSMVSGTTAFSDFFAAIGESLDENHGTGAWIHLRGCDAGMADATGARPDIGGAALASGHIVTGAGGEVHWTYRERRGPDYYCHEGYFAASALADGTVTYWQYYEQRTVVWRGGVSQIPDPNPY